MSFLIGLDGMDGNEILALAKKIYLQTWDRRDLAEKHGGAEDVVQSMCKIIVEIQAGQRTMKPDSNIFVYVSDLVRGETLRNWMVKSRKAGEFEHGGGGEDDGGEGDMLHLLGRDEMAEFWAGEGEEAWLERKLDELELTAFEKLLLAQADQAGQIAQYFNMAERTVRKKRQELFKRLIKKYALSDNFFQLRVKQQEMRHPKSNRLGRKKTKAEPLSASS